MPLLTAKMRIPPYPRGLIGRPRLHAVLDGAMRGPVTLLNAPAGWGKTVLLGSWARRARGGAPVAWLTVEPGDVGEVFWSYLRAALDSTGTAGRTLPQPEPGPGDDTFLPRLADALARRTEPVTVILDDFHAIADDEVLAGLEFLLRHTATGLRLVIGTREEPALPLTRWRLDGELTELGARELAFTLDETTELLGLDGSPPPETQAAELHERTEGWPAGVRLCTLAGPEPVVVDYLLEEVLAGQSPTMRETLLRAALPERFCAGLVEALTGCPDGDRVLAALRRTNPFLVPLDAGSVWYRYHRMFGAVLRAELHRRVPGEVPGLHRRAARWLASTGQPAEGLRHALAAHDWSLATTVLVEHWQHLVGYGRKQPGAVPTPPAEEVPEGDAELALACAVECLDRHDLTGAEGYLSRADGDQRLLAEERRERFGSMAAAVRLGQAQVGGDVAGILAAAAALLRLAGDGPARDDGMAALALAAIGAAKLVAGDWYGAETALRHGLDRAERAGLDCPRLECAGNLALVLAFRGELRAAERRAHAALAMPPGPDGPRPGYRAAAHLALAVIEIQRDRLDDAAANLRVAEELHAPTGSPALAATIALTRAQLLQEQGDLPGGYAALRAGRSELREWQPSPHVEHRFAAAEAELRTAHGDPTSARQLLVPMVNGDRTGPAILALALARAYLRDNDAQAATRALPVWADESSRQPRSLRVEAGLVEALAARRLGDHRRATRALERVLALAEPEGFRRVFIRAGTPVRDLLLEHLDTGTAYWSMVTELVDATGAPAGSAGTAPLARGEALTERELTILRYLQSILSNLEIAAELSLSVNTVKTHVRNIYRKLEATGRRDAIRKARVLHLL